MVDDEFPADLSVLTDARLSSLFAKYSAKLLQIMGVEVAVAGPSAGVGVADWIHHLWPHRAGRCFFGPLHNFIGPFGAVIAVIGVGYSVHKFIQLGQVNEKLKLIIAEIQRRGGGDNERIGLINAELIAEFQHHEHAAAGA